MQEQVLAIKNLMLRTLVKRFVSRRFTISVMRAFIEDNGKSTNSPDYRYRLTEEFLAVIRGNGTAEVVSHFLSNHESLISIYASKKKFQKIPVTINGKDLSFSVGKHNELQKAIIEEFGARFAPGAECLYVGDTIEKDLVIRKCG